MLSTLLYNAVIVAANDIIIETTGCCPSQMAKKHIKCLWNDKITNAEVRTRTKQCSIASTLGERRLRWLGDVLQMDHLRIPKQALHLEVPGFKGGPGRPRANWRGIVKDL